MDFIILKVNGEDVSNATHEEAVAAFCKAKEPIIIEVRRRSSQSATSDNEYEESTRGCGQQNPSCVSVSTQTDSFIDENDEDDDEDDNGCDILVGQSMLESCAFYLPPPPPLESSAPAEARGWNQRCSRRAVALSAGSELCLTDLENAYEVRDADPADGTPSRFPHLFGGSIPDCSSSNGNYSDEFTCEEVLLRRQSACERVGLTLCYALNEEDGSTCVLVGEVERGGAAAADGRIREGDRILEINGEAVDSREAVIRLFSVNQQEIRLLVCRPSSSQWDDDGFVEEPSQCAADVNCIKENCEEIKQTGETYSGQLKDCIVQGLAEATTKDATINRAPEANTCNGYGMQPSQLPPTRQQQESSTATESKAPSGAPATRAKPRMGTRLVPQPGGAAVPARAGSVDRDDFGSAQSAAKVSDVSRPSSEDQFSTPEPISTQLQQQPEESSGHDTAYNTAESCRSASLSLKPPSTSDPVQKPWLSRGGSLLSLAAVPAPQVQLASLKGGDARGESHRGRSSSRDKACRGSSGSSSGSNGSRKLAKEAADTDRSRRTCEIIYTNKENLATTMTLQQKLLEGRLLENVGYPNAGGTATVRDLGSGGAGVADRVDFEWVLKRRPDGSRYVVRRPVVLPKEECGRPCAPAQSARNRLLEERQRRLERERASFTTDDDDAASELKMGRYWSRADRRRHLMSAKDSRRRKEERLRGGRAARDGGEGVLRGLREEDEGDGAAELASRLTSAAFAVSQRRGAPTRRRDMDFVGAQELLIRSGRAPELLTVTTV